MYKGEDKFKKRQRNSSKSQEKNREKSDRSISKSPPKNLNNQLQPQISNPCCGNKHSSSNLNGFVLKGEKFDESDADLRDGNSYLHKHHSNPMHKKSKRNKSKATLSVNKSCIKKDIIDIDSKFEC